MASCCPYTSSIFRKVIVALSGVLLYAFIIFHLIGNLGIFGGQEAFNEYAHFLKSKPYLLWPSRLGLMFLFGVHIWFAAQLTLENREAKPDDYAKDGTRKASFASQTMIWSGILIFAFLMFHLAHLTVGLILPEYFRSTVIVEGMPRHDAYVMAVRGFQHIPIVLIYLFAMAVLFFHLCHGFTSLLQTLGIIPEKWSCLLHKLGPALAVLIFVGYASIPLACFTGILKVPARPADTSAEVTPSHPGGGR